MRTYIRRIPYNLYPILKSPCPRPFQATQWFVLKHNDLFANTGVKGRQSLAGRGVAPHKTKHHERTAPHKTIQQNKNESGTAETLGDKACDELSEAMGGESDVIVGQLDVVGERGGRKGSDSDLCAENVHFLGDALNQSGQGGDGAFGGATVADHDEDTGFSFACEGKFGEMEHCCGVIVSACAL